MTQRLSYPSTPSQSSLPLALLFQVRHDIGNADDTVSVFLRDHFGKRRFPRSPRAQDKNVFKHRHTSVKLSCGPSHRHYTAKKEKLQPTASFLPYKYFAGDLLFLKAMLQ